MNKWEEKMDLLISFLLNGNIMSLSFMEATPEEIAVESVSLLDIFTTDRRYNFSFNSCKEE